MSLDSTAGGESGDPASPHFKHEDGRYASGDLRELYFYRWTQSASEVSLVSIRPADREAS